MIDEGQIQFHCEHTVEPLAPRRYGELCGVLAAWREILAKVQLVGQTAGLYGGAGFGNVSGRVGAPSASRGRRGFLVSGTQTGGQACIALEDFAEVQRYDYRRGEVVSRGQRKPSSESMTHGAIYDLSSAIRFVMHAHSPVIWQSAKALSLPHTDVNVGFGTRAMAAEVQRLYRGSALAERRVLVMGGHQDGVIAFGPTAERAGGALLTALAQAYSHAWLQGGGIICSSCR